MKQRVDTSAADESRLIVVVGQEMSLNRSNKFGVAVKGSESGRATGPLSQPALGDAHAEVRCERQMQPQELSLDQSCIDNVVRVAATVINQNTSIP